MDLMADEKLIEILARVRAEQEAELKSRHPAGVKRLRISRRSVAELLAEAQARNEEDGEPWDPDKV